MSLCLQHSPVTTEDWIIHEDGERNEFKLYVPETYAAKQVFLMLSSGEVRVEMKMSKSPISDKLWLRNVRMRPEGGYRYRVITSSGWLMSGKKEHTDTESFVRRITQQCLTHLDVLRLETTPAISVGACEVYMAEIARQIKNSEDLSNAVNEHCREFLDFKCVPGGKTAKLMSVVTASVQYVCNWYGANFVFYCMFSLADSNPSCLTSDRIKSEHARRLLNFFQGATLERSFLQSPDVCVTDVMITLVKAMEKQASWQLFVDRCDPTLTALETMQAKEMTKWHSSDASTTHNLVLKLCKLGGSHDNSERLLFSVIRDIQSLEVFCDALKMCKDDVSTTYTKIFADEKLKQTFKDFVYKEIGDCKNVRDLSDLSAELCKVDCDLLRYVADKFQEKILDDITKKKELANEHIQCLVDLSLCPHLFVEAADAERFLKTLNQPKLVLHRECLFLLLLPEKFGKILQQEAMLTIVYDWLKYVVDTESKRGIEHLYSCMWKITDMHYLRENSIAMLRVQKEILKYLTDGIQKGGHYSDLLTVDSLLKQLHAEAFTAVRRDLEDAIIRIVQCSNLPFKTDFLPTFVNIVLSDRLFIHYDRARCLLQCVIRSTDRSIHSSFVDIMKEAKFWNLIEIVEDRETLFRKWIEVARDVHCKHKAEETKQSTVIHLYEYVSDSLSKLFVLNSYPNIQQLLEDTVAEQYAAMDPVAVVDMLTTVSEISEPAKELLNKHLESLPLRTLLSSEDLNSKFKRLFERRRGEEDENFIKR